MPPLRTECSVVLAPPLAFIGGSHAVSKAQLFLLPFRGAEAPLFHALISSLISSGPSARCTRGGRMPSATTLEPSLARYRTADTLRLPDLRPRKSSVRVPYRERPQCRSSKVATNTAPINLNVTPDISGWSMLAVRVELSVADAADRMRTRARPMTDSAAGKFREHNCAEHLARLEMVEDEDSFTGRIRRLVTRGSSRRTRSSCSCRKSRSNIEMSRRCWLGRRRRGRTSCGG